MTEREILQKELEAVQESIVEGSNNLEDLTQMLGRMNLLSNIFSKELESMGGPDPKEEKDSSVDS